VDALLGALGEGDIGERFRNDDPRWKGVESSVFLNDVMRTVASRNMLVANIDVTILCESPKLQPFKREMVARLARLTHSPAVNVKAGTNEGCDAVGRGEAVAAHAVVLLAAGPESS
jgi:2-C-methyl-D-erythritol 2,4-cyclodiphosphate synthase